MQICNLHDKLSPLGGTPTATIPGDMQLKVSGIENGYRVMVRVVRGVENDPRMTMKREEIDGALMFNTLFTVTDA